MLQLNLDNPIRLPDIGGVCGKRALSLLLNDTDSNHRQRRPRELLSTRRCVDCVLVDEI